MKTMKTKHMFGIGAAVLFASMLTLVLTLTAVAAAPQVIRGADNNGMTSSVDVLSVLGSEGDKVYVDVKKDGTFIAQRLEYTLTSGQQLGALSLNLSGSELSAQDLIGCTLDVYDTNMLEGATPLYSGTINGVYAELDGVKSDEPIGLCTLSNNKALVDDTRNYAAPVKLYVNNTNYNLKSEAPISKDPLTFQYEKDDPAAETATGVVTFVDSGSGAVLETKNYPGITKNSPRTVMIPVSITHEENGKLEVYRTIFFDNKAQLSNPDNLGITVPCMKLKPSEGGGYSPLLDGTYYVANITFDCGGETLATDHVTVTGEYNYTVPSVIYQSIENNRFKKYELDPEATQEDALKNGVLEMNAATDNITTGSRDLKVNYKLTETSDSKTIGVTYTQINATKRVGDPARTIATLDPVTVSYETGKEVAYPPEEVMVGNEKYVLAGSKDQYKFDIKQGGIPAINVYYVPENYKLPDPYEVTVLYKNLANDSIIKTEKHTVTADLEEDHKIAFESNFDQDGVSYVLLPSQESPILHNFYSASAEEPPTYVVYYRDVNDNLTPDVVIPTIRVIYDTDTTTAEGTTPLPTGETLNAINGVAGGLITGQDGTDAEAMRIGDNETPLAQANNGFSIEKDWPLVAGGIGLLVLIGVIVAFAMRKRSSDEQTVQ